MARWHFISNFQIQVVPHVEATICFYSLVGCTSFQFFILDVFQNEPSNILGTLDVPNCRSAPLLAKNADVSQARKLLTFNCKMNSLLRRSVIQ